MVVLARGLVATCAPGRSTGALPSCDHCIAYRAQMRDLTPAVAAAGDGTESVGSSPVASAAIVEPTQLVKPTARGPLAEPPMAPPDGRAALVSELVPLDDTIKSCMRFGLLLTLTCIGLELTSVLYESWRVLALALPNVKEGWAGAAIRVRFQGPYCNGPLSDLRPSCAPRSMVSERPDRCLFPARTPVRWRHLFLGPIGGRAPGGGRPSERRREVGGLLNASKCESD